MMGGGYGFGVAPIDPPGAGDSPPKTLGGGKKRKRETLGGPLKIHG